MAGPPSGQGQRLQCLREEIAGRCGRTASSPHGFTESATAGAANTEAAPGSPRDGSGGGCSSRAAQVAAGQLQTLQLSALVRAEGPGSLLSPFPHLRAPAAEVWDLPAAPTLSSVDRHSF